jgi:hypothetical protein
MTQDDVLFGYRLQLFDLAARTTVLHVCRTFGVHRSTYYRWKAQVDRQGLEMLSPRERRRPQMPNRIPQIGEERIVAFSLGHPGPGPRRIAAMLARPEWGALRVSPTVSGRCCAATGFPRAPSACRRSPASGRPTSRRAGTTRSRGSTATGPASWSASIASSSGAWPTPRARGHLAPRALGMRERFRFRTAPTGSRAVRGVCGCRAQDRSRLG